MATRIPKGKSIRIYKSGEPILPPLNLEEDITLNLSSNFAPIMENDGNTFATTLGKLSKKYLGVGFSSQFQQQGFQEWKTTQPLSFNVNVSFYMGDLDTFNAEKEVFDPMLTLASLPLPSLNGNILVAPGPAIDTVLFPDSNKSDVLSIEIGNIIRIDSIIIERAEPTFSKDVDENDYPIYGKINMDIKSVNVATVEMLNGFKRSSNSFVQAIKNLSKGEPNA